jgi:TolB-like protein/Tfp pilus assembly protein PilF
MICLLRVGIGSQGDDPQNVTADTFVHEGRFGGYEIERHPDGTLYELGHGAMGVTYCALDTSLQRKVALKIIKVDGTGRSSDARERFMREARAAAALRHENIATVYQFGISEASGQCFYAMELISGETLEELVRRTGPLNARTTIEIARQVTAALAAAEKCGLVHRDLKPANLMLVSVRGDTSNGERDDKLVVKIIDFGLAKALNAPVDPMSLTQSGFVGTPAFASPEQFEHSSLDVRSDIYSLGVTLWFALTGKTPFAGHSAEEIHRAQKSAALPVEQLKTARVPSRLRSLLTSMLALEPAARPSTRDLATWLRRCAVQASGVQRTRVALAAAVILILGLSALFVFHSLRTHPSTAGSLSIPAAPEKSIAVLPFENRSREPDNAFFADGVQQEILTRLSRIADLKVISHTSTQHYKSAPENLPEIGRQLGVAHVLEGSVQKNGEAVRVNVQLIKAANDSHLWAETFDRKLTDLFSVETEVAKTIADQLQAKLTGQEEQVIAAKPTDNPEAYNAYLRGLAYSLKSLSTMPANLLGAQKYLREAVRLDPKFALAWAQLSLVDATGYLTTLQRTVALREEARQAAETALALQPNLGEAVLAKGFYHYACLKDYDGAVRYYEQARQFLRNSSRIPELLAYVAGRQGQWDRSETFFTEAERLDPRNVSLLTQHALTYICHRRFPEALRKFDQVLNITPDDVDALAVKASIGLAEGDLPQAGALLAPLHPNADHVRALDIQVYQAILERRPEPAIRRLKEILAKPDPALGYIIGKQRFYLGWAEEVAGDRSAAQESWRQARSELESFLKEQPENYILICDLALTDMGLGDKPAAFAMTERAMATLPIEKDAVFGPIAIEVLARVAARLGEPDRAIAALGKVLSVPYQGALGGVTLTPALLRLDPMFDPLRGDARFEALVQKTAGAGNSNLAVPEKSIAVLPFENLSRDPDITYFVEGIHEEILTRLAKIADLRVISRTSTQPYQSKPRNLSQIAQELGVANIVEGSVQRAANQVRVNVQLINAQTDSHLWAETYDRKMTGIFDVESEIAKGIAESLQAKLTGREQQALAAKSTNNPEAYDEYLRGVAFEAHSIFTATDFLWKAISFYEHAVQLDPNFALAWARLSRAHGLAYFTCSDTSAARRDAAKKALEHAQKLEPNSPETELALGYYQYWALRDYPLAKTTFQLVGNMLPHSSDVLKALGLVAQRQGNWDGSVASWKEALALDPRNTELLSNAALAYTRTRQFPAALKLYDRALDIIPNDPELMALKAGVCEGQGDLAQAANLLSTIDAHSPSQGAFEIKMIQLRLERNQSEAVRLLRARQQMQFGSHPYKGETQVMLALAQRAFGDIVEAKRNAEQARNTLGQLQKDQPDNASIVADLSLASAMLGEKDAAVKEAEQAMMLLPSAKDRVSGPGFEENLAVIQMIFGETSRPISTLARLLQTPYSGWLYNGTPVTPVLLRLDPVWDPLRGDPRFQELCKDKQPPATP